MYGPCVLHLFIQILLQLICLVIPVNPCQSIIQMRPRVLSLPQASVLFSQVLNMLNITNLRSAFDNSVSCEHCAL